MNHKKMPTPAISHRVFWFSLLAAPLAWIFQEIASWLLIDAVCSNAGEGAGTMTALIMISAAALLVTIIAWFISFRLFRNYQDEHPQHLTGTNLSSFQAAIGLIINSVFLLGVFWASWSIFAMRVCEQWR